MKRLYAVQISCRISEIDERGNPAYSSGALEMSESVVLRDGIDARGLFATMERIYSFTDDLRQRQQ